MQIEHTFILNPGNNFPNIVKRKLLHQLNVSQNLID